MRDDLDTLQIISFLPPRKYETGFNELLTTLGLSTYSELQIQVNAPTDPAVALAHQMMPQIEMAFIEQDWSAVIRKAEFLIKRAPAAISSEVYRMQGRALYKEGEAQPRMHSMQHSRW